MTTESLNLDWYVEKAELGKNMTREEYQRSLCAYRAYADALGLAEMWRAVTESDSEDDLTGALAVMREFDASDDIGEMIRRELVSRAFDYIVWRFENGNG